MAWFFGKSRAAEQRRGAVQAYVGEVSAEPDEQDVHWLASIAGDGDVDRARWELRYARRAIGLLVAEREALDDRTGSLVSREIRQALQMDRSVAAGMVAVAERQFNQRLTSFRSAFADRAAGDAPELRLARVLLDRTGVRDVSGNIARASATVRKFIEGSQEGLRRTFGVASVPEDVPPSVWGAKRSG